MFISVFGEPITPPVVSDPFSSRRSQRLFSSANGRTPRVTGKSLIDCGGAPPNDCIGNRGSLVSLFALAEAGLAHGLHNKNTSPRTRNNEMKYRIDLWNSRMRGADSFSNLSLCNHYARMGLPRTHPLHSIAEDCYLCRAPRSASTDCGAFPSATASGRWRVCTHELPEQL